MESEIRRIIASRDPQNGPARRLEHLSQFGDLIQQTNRLRGKYLAFCAMARPIFDD